MKDNKTLTIKIFKDFDSREQIIKNCINKIADKKYKSNIQSRLTKSLKKIFVIAIITKLVIKNYFKFTSLKDYSNTKYNLSKIFIIKEQHCKIKYNNCVFIFYLKIIAIDSAIHFFNIMHRYLRIKLGTKNG